MDTDSATGIVKTVLDRYQLSKQYTASYFSDANTKEDLYRCHLETNNLPYRSKVFDPKSFSAVEKIVPRMVANRPRGDFMPREAGDMISVKTIGELFNYDWDRASMFLKLVRLVKGTLKVGTAYGRVPWRFERREVRYREPIVEFKSIQFGSMEKKKMQIVYDGPDFENTNFYDVFPSPQMVDVQDPNGYLIHITYPTIDQVKQYNDAGQDETRFKNLGKLEDLIKDGTGNTDDTYRVRSRTISGASDYTLKDKTLKQFKLATMYEGDRWVSVASDYNLKLRDIPNPYYHGKIPFIKLVDYPLENEWFGLGEIEPVERLQRALNAVINQRLDNVNLILNTGWKVGTNGGVDLTSLVSRPGMIAKARDISQLERIDIPDVTGQTFADTYTFLQNSLIDALGVQDYTIQARQTTPTGQKTARGMSLQNEEMNARFKLKIQIFEEEVIKQIAEQWLQLRQQFTTRPQVIRITGKDNIQYLKNNIDPKQQVLMGGDYQTKFTSNDQFGHLVVEPNDIVGEYDFIPQAGSTQLADPIADRLAFVELINTLKTLGQMVPLNWPELITELFERYQIKGADRFIQSMPGVMNGQVTGLPGVTSPQAVAPALNQAGPSGGLPQIQPGMVPNQPVL